MNLLPDKAENVSTLDSSSLRRSKENHTFSPLTSDMDLDTTLSPMRSKRTFIENMTVDVPTKTKAPSRRQFFLLLSIAVLLLLLLSAILGYTVYMLRDAKTQYDTNVKTLTIESTPTEVNVYLDNVYWGITPLKIKNVDLSYDRTLKLKKDGYTDITETVNKDNFKSLYSETLVSSVTVAPIDTPTITPAASTELVPSVQIDFKNTVTTSQMSDFKVAVKNAIGDNSYATFDSSSPVTLYGREYMIPHNTIYVVLTDRDKTAEFYNKLIAQIADKSTKSYNDLVKANSPFISNGNDLYALKSNYYYIASLASITK